MVRPSPISSTLVPIQLAAVMSADVHVNYNRVIMGLVSVLLRFCIVSSVLLDETRFTYGSALRPILHHDRPKERTTFDLNPKYTSMGPLGGGVANLMPIGLTLPSTSQAQLSPYSIGQMTPVANLQSQPGFLSSPNTYPLSPAYSSGWGAVPTPTQAPASLPTLTMETNLNMDSAGAMASNHEEYLNLMGNYHGPAMANVLYGSDSYHGLHGNSSQESNGTQQATQDSVGHMEGGTSQLYNIATMGEQNQAITAGFSEAIGTGSVFHQSSSNVIDPTLKANEPPNKIDKSHRSN